MTSSRRLVDLSHTVIEGMLTYPGIPAPVLGSHLSFADSAGIYDPGVEFSIGTISMAANTGTYLDTPAHRYRDGADLSQVPLSHVADLPGVLLTPDIPADRAVTAGLLTAAAEAIGLDASGLAGHAVLVRTGHDRHWGSDAYLSGHPYLAADAAEFLATAGATLVGVDTLNIDGTHTGQRPVHSALLAAGIPVVEHLTALDQLPPTGFRFTAAPPAVRGMGTFTVRAHAVIGG